MITEITMNGVASYKQAAHIPNLKKFNLFYGLNGTGKSTLSKYLAVCTDPNDEYKNCSYKTDDPDIEVFVYNQNFVKAHFQENPQQQGIFTLDKANTEALTAITSARQKINQLTTKKNPFVEQIESLKKKQESEGAKLIDVLWEERQVHSKTILHKCLDGSGKKQSNYDKVLGAEICSVKVEDVAAEFERLANDLTELSDSSAEKKVNYFLLGENLGSLETNSLLNQKIVGAEDSYLSDIVSKLSHQDWITQGIKSYIDQTDDCPFCARSMDQELKTKIKSFINTNYQIKLSELESVKVAYIEKKKVIEQKLRFYKDDLTLIKNSELKNSIERLQSALDLNVRMIEKKCEEPSQAVQLKETLGHIQEIDNLIAVENQNIDAFNKKIDNRKAAISQITKEFWQLIRKKFERQISDFKEAEKTRQKGLIEAQSQAKELQDQIKIQQDIIANNQKNTKNVESAVNRINALLKSFGMEGFQLEKVDTIGGVQGVDNISDLETLPLYEIIRDDPSDEEKEFETLSEGEKTLISFLYFTELCQGLDDADKDGDTSKRIIVIDDPISSLSFNLVFDIAILIKDIFLRKKTAFRQIFILTHHLYFFHELLGNPKDDSSPEVMLYRVYKSEHTKVCSINRDDIQNHYQSYWKIVRDVSANPNYSAILPNAMRNILEYYFSFVHGEDKYFRAIEKLSKKENDPSYKAFVRYIGRGSHSDVTNITDMDEIDVEKFISYFREIFVQTDFENHYLKMMGETPRAANDEG